MATQLLKKPATRTHGPSQVGCDGCQRKAGDDGSWNKRTILHRYTRFVCHVCFAGVRQPWREEFLLSEKARFGTVHTPRGYPTTELDLIHIRERLQRHQERHFPSRSLGVTHLKTSLPYAYLPLSQDQIRVLDILPGEGDSDICCAVQHIDLDEAQIKKYEALSYCWEGPDEEKKTIWIEGCHFAVSQSLFVAMKCLRDPRIPRTFWIDAISIDQDQDDKEKTIQISLMGRIYQNAFEVVVWLGSATRNSDDVMDAIANYDIQRIQSQEFADGFADLLRRPWFFRTWTVQEFVLVKFPPSIQCGAKVVTSGQFLAVRVFLRELRVYSDQVESEVGRQMNDALSLSMIDDIVLYHPTARLIDLRSTILDGEGSPSRMSLARTLRYYRSSQVKYIADKVYGTLGLVNKIVHDHIQASSAKSVSDAYTEAMTYMINVETEEHDVEVLQLYLTFPCSLMVPNPIPGLPSWVPDLSQDNIIMDWSTNYVWFWLHQTTRDDGRKPLAELQHGRHQITIQHIDRSMFKVYDNVLFVKGFLVDHITDVVQSTFYQGDTEDFELMLNDLSKHTEEIELANERLKPSLDQLRNFEANEIPLGDSANSKSLLSVTSLAISILQTITLRQIEKTCRKVANTLGDNTPDYEWMTHIWSDLFQGFGEIHKLSEEQFKAGFRYIIGSHSPEILPYWYENGDDFKQLTEEGGQAAVQILIHLEQIFDARKCFFMTKSSGVYGTGTSGIMDGDKVAFLFPPYYMAFILRPHGNRYRLVGPCFVPPVRRDNFMNKVSASGRRLDEFHIV